MKTKNLLRAVVATLVAGAMGLAGVGSAMADTTRVSAEDLAKQQTLTVTANEDISNRTLKAVPLAYYSYAQTNEQKTEITGFDLIDAGHATSIADALTDAGIDTSNPTSTTGTQYKYDKSNPMVWVVQNLLENDENHAGNLRDFLDELKNVEGIADVDDAVSFSEPEDGDGTKMTASVRPGVYAVLDKTVSSKGGKVPIVMFNGTGINGITTLRKSDGTTYALGTVDYKIHETTVTKRITKAEDGTVGNEGASAETAIGKTVGFEMTSTVPNWTGYDKYYYAINDTYSKGLTYDADKDDMVVTVAGKTLVRDTDYKVVAESGKFHIIFAPTTNDQTTASDIVAMKTKFPVGAAVKVAYSMTVNRNAVAGKADTNTNSVEYSHNPNTVTDHATTDGEITKVYVGQFTLTKTDTSDKPLAGAEFKVYEKDKTDTPVRFVQVDVNTTARPT